MPKVVFLLFITFICNKAFGYIQELEEPYTNLSIIISSTPQKVIDQLTKKPSKEGSSLQKAQKEYILSQAYYILVYPDEALAASRRGLEHINFSSEPWLYHSLKLAESLALDISGVAEEGIPAAVQALKWAQSVKNKNLTIHALIVMGHLHTTTMRYLAALDYLQRAYDLADNETSTHKSEVAGIIAILYEERRENRLSIPYFEEAVEYNREKQNHIELSIVLYGLGRAYVNVGEVEKGINYLQESADISTQVNDFQGIAYAYKELAGIYMHRKNYTKALELLNPALEWFEQSNNKFMLFDVNKVLSDLNLRTDNIEKANHHYNKASQYINEKNQPLQYLSLEKLHARIQAHTGNHEQAYSLLNQTMQKETQLESKKSTEQLHLLRSEFDLERKEKENQILSTNNQLQATKLESQTRKSQILQLLFLSALSILGLLTVLALRTRKARLKFEYLANHDGLTKLYNRNHVMEEAENLLVQSQQQNTSLHLAMMDIDHFKKINDTWGHSAGDEVLKIFAKTLKKTLGENVIYGRFGGEEFLAVFPNFDINTIKKRLNTFRNELIISNKNSDLSEIKPTVSIGISQTPPNTNLAQLIKNADQALYQAKARGRDKIVIYGD